MCKLCIFSISVYVSVALPHIDKILKIRIGGVK